MRRTVVMVALATLAVSLASEGSAGGRAVRAAPAFEVFPGTPYDSAFTRSYEGARGIVVAPAGGGSSPPCRLVASGLRPETGYSVYVDVDGTTAGDVSTAGPWLPIGGFTTNRGGHGEFLFASSPGPGTAIYVNETSVDLTVLISDNLP